MAKARLNSVLIGLQGKVGNLVFKHFRDGIVVAQKPQANDHDPTSSQLAQRERFKLAVAYGKAVLADPTRKAPYEAFAKKKRKRAIDLCIADFLHPPSVDEIDLKVYSGKTGETIRVQASDDFEVTDVTVQITDGNGIIVEQGAAIRLVPHGFDWEYRTTTDLAPDQSMTIGVTATDRPGHKTTKVKVRA